MNEKLNKEQLLRLLDKIMQPEAARSEKEGDALFLAFCAGCPDPVEAWRLLVECLDPMTDEQMVERALAMPLRKMADVPPSELPTGHPLRAMAE